MPAQLLAIGCDLARTAADRVASGAAAPSTPVLERALITRRAVPGPSPWPLLHHLLGMAVVAVRSNDPATAEQLLAEADG